MTADVIPLRPTFNQACVEISSPGTQSGRPFYTVDYVEADGCRSGVWDGTDLDEARQVARECGEGGAFPVLDLTGVAPVEIPPDAVH